MTWWLDALRGGGSIEHFPVWGIGDLLGEEGDTLVMSSLVGGLSRLEGDGDALEAPAPNIAASCNLQSAIWLGKVCQ